MAHISQDLQPALQPAMTSSSGSPAVEFRFNPDTYTVDVSGQRVRLTKKEYQILELLWTHKGATVSKKMVLSNLYGDAVVPRHKIIDVFICKIRKKLVAATHRDYIETIWGRGYMLLDQPDEKNLGP